MSVVVLYGGSGERQVTNNQREKKLYVGERGNCSNRNVVTNSLIRCPSTDTIT